MEHSRLTLSDYNIIRELGSGSYGSAHLAHHTPSDTKHVIKRIKICHMTPKEVQTARQEVQVLSSLSHPYITQFQGSCEEDGYLLIAMDYCAGGDLHSIITKRNGILFPEDRVLDWFVQLCLAIKYIHDHKILHRDIKSQNIFLTDDGKVRLGDFGISKILNSSSELAKTCIGTPYYLSPEMCENKPYNNKSDIWALGCVLYEMLTLKHAFEANNMKGLILKIIKGIYPPVAPRYSRDIRLLLSQIFQREPQARPSICAVLRKTFILKRVSKFIPGCEEEELKESLIRRKYHVPASARSKIVCNRRPSDITEPAAKYGISLNRKVTHKSPKKQAGRLSKQIIPSGKQVTKVAPKNTVRPRPDSRKRCPSEDILSSKDVQKPEAHASAKRYQKRSKSVPNAFRQMNNPKVQQQCNKIMNPSPVKLKLMLDSAGLKKREKDDIVHEDLRADGKVDDEDSCGSPGSPGWLADEFLTKKLKAAYGKRKLVEALIVDEACGAASCNGTVTKCVLPDEGASVRYVSKPSAVTSGKNVSQRTEKPKMCKAEVVPSGGVELPNPKDVKELANQSLKWQGNHCSEGDESSDAEETRPAISPDHLRKVMQKKLKNLGEERAKKMSQMVSERRQWAYEMEKLSTSVPRNNDENVLKPIHMTSQIRTDEDEKMHHKSKKDKKLHKIVKESDSTTASTCLKAEQVDDNLDKVPISATSNETFLVHQTRSNDIISSVMEVNTVQVPDTQKVLESIPLVECDPQHIRNISRNTHHEKDVNDITTQDNTSKDKVSCQEVKCKDNSGNGIRELVISQDSLCTATQVIPQEPVTEDSVKSLHTTPSMRARWGAVHTADLEKSPLETTASEMDTTSSSDCVFVYREAGERKQWKKGGDDIVSLLAEAQIIEDRKGQCDMEETKSLMDVKKPTGNESSEQQHKPVQMNSTFSLKEGLKECEGESCVCKSHISTTKIEQKSATVLQATFQIDKSNFEKEMKAIGPPLLNSTFDMAKLSSDKVISAPVPVVLNSTYDINKKESVIVEADHLTRNEENFASTFICDINISKERQHKENLQNTYTISCDSKESEHAVPKPEEVLVTDGKVTTEQVTTKTKGGLLEKLRLHLTPQSKTKYQKLDNNVQVSKLPLTTEGDSSSIDSESGSAPRGKYTPVRKRKGTLKFGISGILRKLSSKHLTKTPTRSRSVEMVEKDPDDYEDCDKAHSDTESPQQEVMEECGTVKFLNILAGEKADQGVIEHTGGSEGKQLKISLIAPECDDKTAVSEDDGISVTTHSTLADCSDDNSNAIKTEVCCENKTSFVAGKQTKHLEGEGRKSDIFPGNSTMSTDSGINSQRTSIYQTSSTDCNNSQSLFNCSLGGSRNETGTYDLLKTNSDWVTLSNFSEATTSTVLMQSPQVKQENGSTNTTGKCLSSHTKDVDVMKTTLLDATAKENFQDVSPVSTSGIQISVKVSTELEEEALQSQCKNVELDSSQIKQNDHETVTVAEPKSTELSNLERDLQTTQMKITSCNEVSNNQYKQENTSRSSSEQPVLPHSPARPRPTVLNINKNTIDNMTPPQDSSSRHNSLSRRKCKPSQGNYSERNKMDIYLGSQELAKRSEDELCVYSEPTTSHTGKPHVRELFSSSDEESEDQGNIRQLADFLISSREHRREDSKKQQSELWHLDRDGGVVPGGGGVYGWIEEQRAKLEDELSMDLFMKAYHLLEAAQEREGCVVGESVSQVESLLGPCHHHLAYDILQLVVAESVYHN